MLRVITTEALKALMDADKKVVVVNVLSAEAYSKEHIAGSISMPLGEIEALAFEFLRKDEPVVLYCGSSACRTSETAGPKLEKLGFTDVRRYEEGIEGWREAGYRIEGSGFIDYCPAGEACKAAV